MSLGAPCRNPACTVFFHWCSSCGLDSTEDWVMLWHYCSVACAEEHFPAGDAVAALARYHREVASYDDLRD